MRTPSLLAVRMKLAISTAQSHSNGSLAHMAPVPSRWPRSDQGKSTVMRLFGRFDPLSRRTGGALLSELEVWGVKPHNSSIQGALLVIFQATKRRRDHHRKADFNPLLASNDRRCSTAQNCHRLQKSVRIAASSIPSLPLQKTCPS
jgi:hypothetical protein